MKQNRTAYRTIAILKYLSTQDGADLNNLCAALELPKTSCYDILETLVDTGMVRATKGDKKRYVLAVGAYQLGTGYLRHFSIEKMFDGPMRQLSIQLNKTCFFAIPDKTNVVYLLKQEPENPILTLGKVGGANPMYCTALGKAMLAHLPEETAQNLVSKMDYQPRTTYTHTSAQSLLGEFPIIRKQGYAVDFRELEYHGLCVAAPVFRGEGRLYGAVSVSDLYRPEEDVERIGNAVAATARELSILCGLPE